jgi:subtilase family serine protease
VTPAGYGPSTLVAAYKLDQSKGSGQTVAVVDAYDDPNAESDLAVYRTQYGLPACTTANGCFKKVNQSGSTTNLPRSNAGWAGEISLDLDMVSATCPNCHILLVEATSSTFTNLAPRSTRPPRSAPSSSPTVTAARSLAPSPATTPPTTTTRAW